MTEGSEFTLRGECKRLLISFSFLLQSWGREIIEEVNSAYQLGELYVKEESWEDEERISLRKCSYDNY